MIVALNNKSNLDYQEFKDYLTSLLKINTRSHLILCPTFLNLSQAKKEGISLGSQNVSKEEDGAFTGEVSARQLKSYNVKYAIIGHSERREYQKETMEEIHSKLVQLLRNEIIPILCIGETKKEREENKIWEVLKEEITSAIEGLTKEEQEKIIVAYEPIWSIGTGNIPSKEELEEVFTFIKTLLPNNSLLYGGSANEENITKLKEIKDINGYLLGGLSLKVEKLQIFLQKLEE